MEAETGRLVRVAEQVEKSREDNVVGRLDELEQNDDQRWPEASIGRTNEHARGAQVIARTPAPQPRPRAWPQAEQNRIILHAVGDGSLYLRSARTRRVITSSECFAN
jgi:hypothetical protein